MDIAFLKTIQLIDDRPSPSLDLGAVASYLEGHFPALEVVRPRPFSALLGDLSEGEVRGIARELAFAKVIDPARKGRTAPPLEGEVEFEMDRLRGAGAIGIVQDGCVMQSVFHDLTYSGSPGLLFTDRLFATWDASDLRYHLRAAVYGPTALISTTGIVEAPAKPRKYYLGGKRKEFLSRDEYVDRDDERLTEVAIGYAMQAVMYLLVGHPFCDDPDCRLYNSHWQEELIRSQLGGGYEYCPRHRKIIEEAARKKSL